MADKEDSKNETQMVESAKTTDRDGAGMSEKVIELGESSAQGEARGYKVPNKPYCHRCLSKGHVKEECVTPLLCDISASLTHLKQIPTAEESNKGFFNGLASMQ
jgi:hypothetical protein